MDVFGSADVEVRFSDPCNLQAFENAVVEAKPACVLLETVSNPMMRVPELDRVAEITRKHGAILVVDGTFTTPVLLRPFELGADMVVHSASKYLAGHGDVLGGILVAFGIILGTLGLTSGGLKGDFGRLGGEF